MLRNDIQIPMCQHILLFSSIKLNDNPTILTWFFLANLSKFVTCAVICDLLFGSKPMCHSNQTYSVVT